MAYPQPNADQYSINGYQFFRLNTPLVSDGDIYESQQSGLGFCIGPDSDISKVNIAYFDDQVANYVNQVAIGPNRPFFGRLDARNEVRYMPSHRSGRVLLWPDELFNVDFRPGDFDPGQCRIDFVTPVLDVIEYFTDVTPQPLRNDKTYLFERLPWKGGGGERYYIVVPFYGRRYASFTFANLDIVATSIKVSCFGVAYQLGNFGTEIPLFNTGAVLPFGEYQKVVVSNPDGMFDALYFKFEYVGAVPTARTPTRIIVSDRQA